MDRTLVALHTETAALHGAPHLVELGAVRVEDGEIAAHFRTLVRPEVPIEAGAHARHGLHDADLRDAPDAGAALQAFFDFAGDAWLAAHGAERHASALAFECARRGLDPPSVPVLDTLALARRFAPESADHELETLAGLFELEDGGHAGALSGAVHCWKVLEECAERGGVHTAAALLALSPRVVGLAQVMPDRPHLPRRLRALEEALRGGERVTLLYGEGEEPAQLGVAPRFLYRAGDRGYLEAECGSSGMLKTYRLDRIQRVTPA